jgi:hypothetical protein
MQKLTASIPSSKLWHSTSIFIENPAAIRAFFTASVMFPALQM